MTLDLDPIKQRAGLKRWPTVAELGLIKDDNAALINEVERLQGIAEKVRELHPAKSSHRFIWEKYEYQLDPSKEPLGEEASIICRNCLTQYPCPSIIALEDQ